MSRPPSQQKWESSMNIIRGSLDEITRPASNSSRNGSRAGSRVSQHSSTTFRRKVETSGAFEILPPEITPAQECDVAVEEYDSAESDYSDDSFEESVESNQQKTENNWSAKKSLDTKMMRPEASSKWSSEHTEPSGLNQHFTSNQIALTGGEEPELDSDEENDIVKQIRAEITQQVKQEMKGELDLYRKKFEADSKAQEEDDLADMEPKLKEAILKMRKYDRILRKRVVREKEVKHDRVMLQRRLREELDQLNSNTKEEGKKELKEVKTNTERFLALAPPPKHSEGIVDEDETPLSPVFPTQVLDDGTQSAQGAHGSPRGAGTSFSKVSSDDVEFDDLDTGKGKKKRNKDEDGKKGQHKDFVKRNIQLAADAGNIIAMTDDEKHRVENLLADLDSLPDIPEEGTVPQAFEDNPFAVVVQPGEGFLPDQLEMKALQDIDSRLKALLPASDFESITSTPTFNAHREEYKSLFTRTGIQTTDEYIEQLGEKALKDTREDRDYKKRLADIEGELNMLTCAVEQEMESPVLSEDQLQDLIQQCLRTMSRASAETESLSSTPRSPRTAQLELLQNPPKLSEDVLQSLLTEARGSIASSRVNTYRSEIEDSVSHDDGTVMESLTEDKLRELLHNSRATSRSSSSTAGTITSNETQNKNKLNNSTTDNQPVLNNLTNNAQRPSKSSRAAAQILRNSFCEAGDRTDEDSETDPIAPHPPNSGRKSSAGKSRTYSPLPQ